jgi:hypothetical protein
MLKGPFHLTQFFGPSSMRISEIVQERANDLLFEDGGAPGAERVGEVRCPGGPQGLRIDWDPSVGGGVGFNRHSPWNRRIFTHELVDDSKAGPIKVSVTIQFHTRPPQFR